MKKLLPIFLLFASLSSYRLLAGTTGILEGTVKDKATGEGIFGANILVLGTLHGTSTGENGSFQITNLRAGVYDLRVSSVGYQPLIYRKVTIVPDVRTRLELTLTPSAVELEATEVTAERPLIQKDVTATMYSVTDIKIEKLPVNTLQDIVSLQAGVTREGNVRGGRTTEVMYLVDGFPIQDVIGGGAGSDVPKSSIVEMTIHTGGFDAEYGNALSGVVNAVTKAGGNTHRFLLRADNDRIGMKTQTSKNTEVELSAGGPIEKDRAYYFFSSGLLLSNTRWWQDLQYYFSSPILRDLNGFGKVDYHFSPETHLAGQVLYSFRKWRDYEYSWRFNLAGLHARERNSYRAAVLWSHTLSENSFYTVSLSQYHLRSEIGEGDKSRIDTTPYEYDFFLQYVVKGARAWRVTSRQNVYTLKADFTSQINPLHLFKAGIEFHQYDILGDVLKVEPQKTFFGKPIPEGDPLSFSSVYRYYPRTGSIYLQSKLQSDIDGALLNIGVRYDFLAPRALRPAIELVPKTPTEFEQVVTGYVPSKFKGRISPRLGLSYPATKNLFFFVNFGVYFQLPLFEYLYSGLNPIQIAKTVPALVGNPDLKPETTRMWEFSVKYILPQDVVGTVSVFSKQTDNLIDTKTFLPGKSRISGDYGFAEYVNSPQARAYGFEAVLTRDRGSLLTGTLSYTYMVAKGLAETASEGLSYYQWGFPAPAADYYLSWDQRHTLKAVGALDLPFGIVANIIWQFHTARPYTFYPSRDGFTPEDPKRIFLPNNERMTDNSTLDLKVAKEVLIGSENISRVSLYVDVRNVFNRRNVRWMDSSGRVGGQLGDPSAYYDPRRVRLGLRVEI